MERERERENMFYDALEFPCSGMISLTLIGSFDEKMT